MSKAGPAVGVSVSPTSVEDRDLLGTQNATDMVTMARLVRAQCQASST